MIRIGIEAQRIFRTHKHGMDVVVLELIRHLQQLDVDQEYVVFVKKGPDRDCLEEGKNVSIVEVDGFSYPDWEQIHLPRAARRAGVDLLHLTSNTAPLSLFMPSVITLHDIIYLERLSFKGTAYQNFGNLYRRWNVPKVIRRAAKILTVSDFEGQHILRRFPELADKLEVVPNGVSPIFSPISRESDVATKVIKRYQLPPKFIFFLGNMAPKKNMRRCLSAYASYVKQSENPLPLVLAETKKEELKAILGEIGRKEVESHILLTGYIEQSILPVFYSLASLFLYPSLRESFGMPIIEAMACGSPVITSHTSSMPEVAGGAAHLIDPSDTESLTRAMTKILQNEGYRKELIQKGLINAKRYSWASHARQVAGIYESLVREKQPSPSYYQ